MRTIKKKKELPQVRQEGAPNGPSLGKLRILTRILYELSISIILLKPYFSKKSSQWRLTSIFLSSNLFWSSLYIGYPVFIYPFPPDFTSFHSLLQVLQIYELLHMRRISPVVSCIGVLYADEVFFCNLIGICPLYKKPWAMC